MLTRQMKQACGVLTVVTIATTCYVLLSKSNPVVPRRSTELLPELTTIPIQSANKKLIPVPSITQQLSTNDEPKSVADFFRYLRWTNSDACEIPIDFGGVIYRIGTVVSMDGQKAVCLDQGVAPNPKSCLVYSFGINNEWSFDDKIAEYGCHVFAFDPSMTQQDHQRAAKIKFFKTGLGTKNEDRNSNGWKMRTFSALKAELGHNDQVIDILKIDIEGAEWPILVQMVQEGALKQVKQLAVEFHLWPRHSLQSFIEEYWKVLIGIERSGFTRFSSSVNPFMKGIVQATKKRVYWV